MTVKIYDADQVTVSICGIPILGGFADGEFLRIQRTTAAFVSKVGTGGEVTRSKTLDKRAKATLLVMQSADGNDALSRLQQLDENSPGGAGVGSFLVRDLQGRSLYRGAACWIEKPPDVSFDREATSREWSIEIADLQAFTGGNIVAGG